jgi:hypothetical protein
LHTVEHQRGAVAERALRRAALLQCVVSIAGTMIGQALGSNLTEKLIAGVLLALIGAFLTAPGKHYHRRIVAVALFVALLYTLRRAARALASAGDARSQERTLASPPSSPWTPSNWSTVGRTAIVGFGLGSLGMIIIPGSPAGPVPTIRASARIHDYTQPTTISGRVANHRSGVPVTLHATTFPFGTYRTVAQKSTTRGGNYQFTAKATLATRYRVSLSENTTVRSRIVTIYAGPHKSPVNCDICDEIVNESAQPGPRTFRISFSVSFPTKVYDIESAKPWYFYYGQRNGSRRPPRVIRLVKSVRPTPIGNNTVRVIITHRIRVPVGPLSFQAVACTRATQPFNGFGSPDQRSCRNHVGEVDQRP